MSRYINADNLSKVKYHNLPYTHIVPNDENVESYERGWNDAIDAIIENEPTADVRENVKGEWIDCSEDGYVECQFCHSATTCEDNKEDLHFCFWCGADMRGGANERE